MTNDAVVIAYTDGSCIGNPGPGGWAVHVEYPDGNVLELGGGELETTNNRMELRAAIEAARLATTLPRTIVFTDSAYVRSGVTGWIADWKQRDWKTVRGVPVENRDLWMELDALANPRIEWEWTPAHVGTPGNERCDHLARTFAAGIRSYSVASRARRSRVPPSRRSSPTGVHYLSLVDGIVERHDTWEACERRVRGVRGARFRKVRSPEEEREVLEGWGVGDA